MDCRGRLFFYGNAHTEAVNPTLVASAFKSSIQKCADAIQGELKSHDSAAQRLPHFSSLEALNDWLADECVRLWQQIRHPACDQSIWQIWSEERPFLMPVGQPFDGFVEHTKRVSPTCLIAFERDRYSVPRPTPTCP